MKEITFSTKYEIGQKAVAYDFIRRKLVDIEVSEIQFSTEGINTSVWYKDGKTQCIYREDDIYISRDEFIENL